MADNTSAFGLEASRTIVPGLEDADTVVAARGLPKVTAALFEVLEVVVAVLAVILRGRTVRLRETRGMPESLPSLPDSDSDSSLSESSEDELST